MDTIKMAKIPRSKSDFNISHKSLCQDNINFHGSTQSLQIPPLSPLVNRVNKGTIFPLLPRKIIW